MDKLPLEVVKLLAFQQAAGIESNVQSQLAQQFLDIMSDNETLRAQWYPILCYLQDHPDIIGATVGDSISRKLLEYLQRNKHPAAKEE